MLVEVGVGLDREVIERQVRRSKRERFGDVGASFVLRLFRQRAPEDWAGVIERVAAELRAVLAGDRGRLTPYLLSSVR